jgi:hypothetical protein
MLDESQHPARLEHSTRLGQGPSLVPDPAAGPVWRVPVVSATIYYWR